MLWDVKDCLLLCRTTIPFASPSIGISIGISLLILVICTLSCNCLQEVNADVGLEPYTAEVLEPGSDNESSTTPERKMWKGARCVLVCPECIKNYEGGRGRLHRLKRHIKVEHGGCPKLIEEVDKRYPPKIRKLALHLCPICGETKAGGTAQLKLHIRRVHSSAGVVFS